MKIKINIYIIFHFIYYLFIFSYFLVHDLEKNETSVLHQDMSFCNYSMIDVSECQRVIGSGDLSGNVMLLSPDNLFKVYIYIFSFCLFNNK